MNGQFDFGVINPLKYFVFVSMGLGLLFALIKNDESLGFLLSVVHWQLQTVLPVLIILACYHVWSANKWFRSLSLWWRLTVSGLSGGTVFTPFAFLIDILIGDEIIESLWWIELLDEWVGVTIATTVAWLMINWPMLLGVQYQQTLNQVSNQQVVDDTQTPVEASNIEILTLAGVNDIKDLVAMSAQLHYVDVLLLESHRLVLYSLKDAQAQIPADLGMQIHRSHWVAFAYVERWHKRDRQGEVRLKNGLTLPISRNNLSKFAKAYEAWLQRQV